MTALRYATLLILLSLSALPTAGQPVRNATDTSYETVLNDPFVERQALEGLDQLYDMRFDEAAQAFEAIDRSHPNHPIGPFLTALNTWWEILLDFSDTSHDKAFYKAMDEVVRRSDRMLKKDKNDFDAMFFKGAALGFRGRLRSNRGEWFKAAKDGLKAMDYVLGVAKKDPDNPDYIFGKGLYDYFAAAVPQRYPYVKPVMLFFPHGDEAAGLDALERTASEGRYLQTEARYFLLQINYLFEQDFEKSVENVTWLREHHPHNAFFHTYEGRVYARWGHWPEAHDIFEQVLDRYQRREPGYNDALAEQALYFLARAEMVFRDHDAALDHLLQLEALSARTDEDTYFKVLGRLRQGMTYDALGQRDTATARYREVLEMKDHADAHARARQYLKDPYGR